VVPVPKVPRVVEKDTAVPVETGPPTLLVNVAVMAEELAPFALMLVGSAASTIEAVWLTAPAAPSTSTGPSAHETKRAETQIIRILIRPQ